MWDLLTDCQLPLLPGFSAPSCTGQGLPQVSNAAAPAPRTLTPCTLFRPPRPCTACLRTACVPQEKEKYDALIARAFGNDKLFVAALNSAFEHFLNLSTRSPEYISLFMDDKLRKGLKVGGGGARWGRGRDVGWASIPVPFSGPALLHPNHKPASDIFWMLCHLLPPY